MPQKQNTKVRGKPQHKPTVKNKNFVKKQALVGTPQETIADILGIDSKTLRKHYREELDHSLAKANGEVGGKLYNKAMKGDTAAIIWWEKTRSGMREAREEDHGNAQAISINIVAPQ